jgi:glycosyltransferase involved in cell wall biosynthesis
LSDHPRLTLLILALNAEKELARILPELRDIGDEMVIGIDDTTTDGTAEIARQFTDRVYPVPHGGFCGRGGAEDLNAVECMLPYCRGDWVLRVDQDETLSPLWHDREYVGSLLSDRAATHFWLPRRWIVPPGDHYISNHHWYPDFQLRLFRNIPSLLAFNRTPHAPPAMAGQSRPLTDSWILHWDYVWHDRPTREAKVGFYRALETYTGEEFYLYEEQRYEIRPLNFIYPLPSGEAADTETPRGTGSFHATLELLDWPAALQAGKAEPVLIGIRNNSNRAFRPSSKLVRPANVYLSYHWYTPEREVYEWEGPRHDLPKPLRPGDAASCFVSVAAPEQPGDYLFQPDLLEEGVAWFSSHCPMPYYALRVL